MPRTKGKEPLTQTRILRAAVHYADKNGLEKLNVRELARRLNAGPMSLYYHFASKDELLDAMVEFVAAKIDEPKTNTPWREGITDIALSAHRVMIRHPWVCGIWSQRTLGPEKLAYMEAVLRALREGGFSVAEACDAYHAITVHIEGFGLQAASFPIKPKDIQSAAAGFLGSVEDPDQIPYFIEHVKYHMKSPDPHDHFGMMLNMILDGFESRLAKT